MKHNTNNEFGLKARDIEMLNDLERAMRLDQQKTMVTYYYNKDKKIKETQCLTNYAMLVNTIDDLVEKYAAFNVVYDKDDNILIIREPIPVKIYTLLRSEADQFNFSDIMVITNRGGKIVL